MLEKVFNPLRQLNTHHLNALDYCTYLLAKRRHGRRESANLKIVKYEKRLEVQLKTKAINGNDTI